MIGSEDLVEIYRVAIESPGISARAVSTETAIQARLAGGSV